MSDASPIHGTKPRRLFPRGCSCLGVIGIFLILAGVALGPVGPGPHVAYQNAAMQTSRTIAIAMFQYANDNDQTYPDGKSSTEVFQKLLDGKYVSDPTLFYLSMPGKVKPEDGERLKPENVCFDVTSGVDSSCSDDLPVVFQTGYRVTYAPGANVVQLTPPRPRTWVEWWNGVPLMDVRYPGIAAAYKGNNAKFLRAHYPGDPSFPIDHFIPDTFDAKGKTFRQLGPEGVVK